MNPEELVRSGYDAIAPAYLSDRRDDTADVTFLAELEERLAPGSLVLDIGCGAGVPITRRLAKNYNVTGIDISQRQIEMAQVNVPEAEFRCENIVQSDLGEEVFDAICSYYAIIHVPRKHHKELLADVHAALRPGGLALLCLGANDLPKDIDDDYYGSTMYWSHFDAETYRRMMLELGFTIILDRLIEDETCAGAAHLFVLAQK